MKRRRKVKISVLIAVLLLIIGGRAVAKYITNSEHEPLYIAKAFYFESDYLEEPIGGVMPQYTLQTGVDKIEFLLRNCTDELRNSEVDIEYEVVLTKDGTEKAKIKGTLMKNEKSEKLITFGDLSAGVYVVEAKAVSPYVTTLKAQYTIIDNNYDISAVVYDAEKSPVLQLTVTTDDYVGNVQIKWPEELLPNNTDPLLKSVSGRSCTVAFQPYSEYTFQFFKINPNVVYTYEIDSNQIEIKK